MKVFIPGNVPSSKNSKVMTSKGIFVSKTVRRYLQKIGVKGYSVRLKTVENYKIRLNLFEQAVAPMRDFLSTKQPPHMISFYFVRATRHKFDFLNIAQIVADLLVAHRVIEDDDMTNLIPVPHIINCQWFHYNKENPGCWLDF